MSIGRSPAPGPAVPLPVGGGMPAPVPAATPPMPMAAPASTAGAPPAGAPSPGAPQQFNDLSQELSPAWQLIDFAHRQIGKALDQGGLYQEPEGKAAVRAIYEDLEKIIATYSRAKKTVGPENEGGPSVAPTDEDSTVVGET